MNTNHPAVLRAMYIILVPVVLLIILLNSGWIQRVLPAATVNGEYYSVVRYNYYYFDAYNTFLAENDEASLEELGYDSSVSNANQTNADGITWREYFQQLGEANLAQTVYYCDLAEAAGYAFSEEELAPVQEKLDENAAQQLTYSLSAKNYYISYYGTGMTEEIYTQELTRQVKADAYKAYLEETIEIPQDEAEQWIAENYTADYSAVNLKIITLDALPDRVTGEVGQAQLTALESKLQKLAARYAAGTDFASLQAAFSTCRLGASDGTLTNATESALPAQVADWCLQNQESLAPGDTFSCVDEDSGVAYFVVLESVAEDGAAQEAQTVLGRQTVAGMETEALAGDYAVSRNKLGMTLATA